jgi:hypothetical protein
MPHDRRGEREPIKPPSKWCHPGKSEGTIALLGLTCPDGTDCDAIKCWVAYERAQHAIRRSK